MQGTCTKARSIREVNETRWDAVAGDTLQMSYRWLRLMETHWRYYQPCYLLLENEAGLYAVAVANTSVALEKNFGRLGWLYQRFSLIIRPPFSSLCSITLQPDLALHAVMPDLNAALQQLSRQEKRLLIAIGNVDKPDVSIWQKAGFLATQQPSVSVLNLPANYEDYLNSLHRKERQELRRIRKRAAEFDVHLEAGGLGDDSAEVYALLYEVYAKHGISSQDDMPFSASLFETLADEMPEDILLIRGYVGDKLAGVSFNLLDNTNILALMMGLHYETARPSYLYFILMDEVIRWGIQHGFQKICVGRTNEREKRKHGFSLEPRWLCYRANLKPLNHILAGVLQLSQRGGTTSMGDQTPEMNTN